MSKRDQQALHFFKPVPKKLAPFIDLENMLPPNIELPYPDDDRTFMDLNENDEIVDPWWASRARSALMECLRGSPVNFRQYIWRDSLGGSRRTNEAVLTALKRYGDFKIRLEQVRAVARYDRHGNQFVIPPAPYDDYPYERFLHVETEVVVDEEGLVQIVPDSFAEAIRGIEVARLRECGVCNRVFWAGRITQKCCTPKCANTFRVHRHRYKTDEEKADYKLRRLKREDRRLGKAQKRVSN